MSATRPRVWPAVALLGVLLFTSLMVTILLTTAIWPGEAKLTAPLLCDEALSDPYVVRDTFNVAPGETSMNFTLYCVGSRGEHEDVGFFRPFLVLWLAHTVLLVALGVAALAVRRTKARPQGPAGDRPGPVDATGRPIDAA